MNWTLLGNTHTDTDMKKKYTWGTNFLQLFKKEEEKLPPFFFFAKLWSNK